MSQSTLTEQVNIVTKSLVEDIKNNKLELPSPPELLMSLRRLANDPDSDINDFAELVKHDVNITGRLIKIANCSLFISRNPVTTVTQAINRLGLKKVQSLVTGLVLGQQIMRNKTKGLEDLCKQAWQSSNDVAAFSYVLAQNKTTLDPEQALLAGIVHNIGALPLVLKLHSVPALKDAPEVMNMVANVVIPKLYPRAGHLILQGWHFAPEIIAVAIEHTKPNRTGQDELELADIVMIAHQFNQLDQFDEQQMPAAFDNCPAFNKIWTDWPSAISDLNELTPLIEQMKSDMSS